MQAGNPNSIPPWQLVEIQKQNQTVGGLIYREMVPNSVVSISRFWIIDDITSSNITKTKKGELEMGISVGK